MEQQLIDYLKQNLPSSDLVQVGIGDDAAVLNWQQQDDLVVTADMITDQVDFLLAEADPQLIGRKALAVNLSDLAAMAANPIAVIVSLLLPSSSSSHGTGDPYQLALQLYQGMIPLAEQFKTVIAGGDTNTWDGPLAINITAFGSSDDGVTWQRSGAKPGDQLLVTGPLGGSILGHHFQFTPRVELAGKLRKKYEIHAAMDISDGLSLDLARLCKASQLGVELELANVPISEAANQLAAQSGNSLSPLEHALQDGEDFELLLAVPGDIANLILEDESLGVRLYKIGWFIEETQLWQIDARGQRTELKPKGFLHS